MFKAVVIKYFSPTFFAFVALTLVSIQVAAQPSATLIPTYCDYAPSDTIEITGTEVWQTARYLNRDIVVKSGGKLTIQCVIGLPENARVVVEQGGELILDGGTLTCPCTGDLFRGVFVLGDNTRNNGVTTHHGRFEMKPGSRIEYAEIAVRNYDGAAASPQDAGGIIKIDSSTFRNNGAGIALRDFPLSGTDKIEITNSTFVADTLVRDADNPTSPGPHVVLDNMGVTVVQDNTFEEKTNTGSVRAGVDIYHTHIWPFSDAVKNNVFEGLKTGVKVSGARMCYITQNDFRDNNVGVFVESYLDSLDNDIILLVRDNTFSGNDRGVQATRLTDVVFNVFDNAFNDTRIGAVSVNTAPGSRVGISNNNIDTAYFGIQFFNQNAPGPADLDIRTNTIRNFEWTGIELSGDFSIDTPAVVFSNTVEDFDSDFTLFGDGISVSSSSFVSLLENSVNDASASSPAYESRGIVLNASTDCIARCNVLDDMNGGIVVQQNCSNTQLVRNDFSRLTAGILFASNGNTGPQVYDDSGNEVAHENRWSIDNACTHDIAVLYARAEDTSDYWYVNTTSGGFRHQPHNLASLEFDWVEDTSLCYTREYCPPVITEVGSGLTGCVGFETGEPGGISNGNGGFGSGSFVSGHFGRLVHIASGGGVSAVRYQDEAIYMARRNVLKAVRLDTSLLSASPVLAAFDSTWTGTSMDTSVTVDVEAIRGNFTAARTLNNAFTPTNGIETQHKAFNKVWLDLAIDETTELTTTQESDLEYVAERCPLQFGTGVWKARGLLAVMSDTTYNFTGACDSSYALRQGEIVRRTKPTQPFLTLYPNPTRDAVFVHYILPETAEVSAEIFNVKGRKVAEAKATGETGRMRVPTTDWPSGVYIVKCALNGAQTKVMKVVVQ